MHRILIVEDEQEPAERLREYLNRYAREHGCELSVNHSKSADTLLQCAHTYDLVFLDIELPGMDGMDAATLLRSYDSSTLIIFVTNLAQYAVRGYEVDALDFIVKPVSYHAVSMRMDKALRVLKHNAGRNIVVNTRGSARVFPENDLVYVETINHDLVYHIFDTADDDFPRERGSLTKFEQSVVDGPFLRISSHCIINMNHVTMARADMLKMSTGEVLYPSRSRKTAAFEALAKYLGGSI